MTRRFAGAAVTALLALGSAGPALAGGPSRGPAPAVLDEHQNGATVTVHVGAAVHLVLHNTYWRVQPATGTALQAHGSPTTSAAPPGKGCVPGAGCGAVRADWRAVRVGTATVRASRTTCGEALQCTGSQGRYAVVVRVVR